MKYIKYVVTLTQGSDRMKFDFGGEAAADTFARMAFLNHVVSTDYKRETEKFGVSTELVLEEGDGEDD